MKKMSELNVGEELVVTVESAGLGYGIVEGIEYFVMCSDDLEEVPAETNSLDTYYVTKDYSKVYLLDESSEFPVAKVKRIQ